MELVEKVLSKPKITRTDLSNVYKQIKQLKLNITWLDLYRKSTRENTLGKVKEALEPKPIKVKKSTNKNKLKALFETIKNAKPEAEQYLVLTINFTDNTTKHATITPQSKAKIMEDIMDAVADKEHLEASGFSDATVHRIKGKKSKTSHCKLKINLKLHRRIFSRKILKPESTKRELEDSFHSLIGLRMSMSKLSWSNFKSSKLEFCQTIQMYVSLKV